jgi:uncharacterized protein DUF4242
MPAPRTFLVEAYAPAASNLTTLLDQARRATAMEGTEHAVLHIRSILVAEDETCFHLFEADSIEAVSAVVTAAHIHANRIVEVTT